MVFLLPQGQGRGSEIDDNSSGRQLLGGKVAGGTSGLLGEGNMAQLLESYFWVGSAFQRAGPLRVVEGEEVGRGSGEGKGSIWGAGPWAYPKDQLGG